MTSTKLLYRFTLLLVVLPMSPINAWDDVISLTKGLSVAVSSEQRYEMNDTTDGVDLNFAPSDEQITVNFKDAENADRNRELIVNRIPNLIVNIPKVFAVYVNTTSSWIICIRYVEDGSYDMVHVRPRNVDEILPGKETIPFGDETVEITRLPYGRVNVECGSHASVSIEPDGDSWKGTVLFVDESPTIVPRDRRLGELSPRAFGVSFQNRTQLTLRVRSSLSAIDPIA